MKNKSLILFDYHDYTYNEYYNQEFNSYIRLCDNGYLRYDDDNQSFVALTSNYNNLLVVENIIVNTNTENPIYTNDLLFLTINEDSIEVNNDISIYRSDYQLNGLSFAISQRNVNKNAKYIYAKQEPNNLLINLSFSSELTSVEDCLSLLNLSSFNTNVSSFSCYKNGKTNITFSFSLLRIDVLETINSIIVAGKNQTDVTYIGCRFDDYRIIKTVNINSLNLSNDFLIDNCQALSMIRAYSYPFDEEGFENGLYFANLLESLSYAEILKQKGPNSYNAIITFLESLTDEDFIDKHLVFSNVVMMENSGVRYAFQNMYLKDNSLFIVLNRTSTIEYTQQVISYGTFPFWIPNNIDYSNIITVF